MFRREKLILAATVCFLLTSCGEAKADAEKILEKTQVGNELFTDEKEQGDSSVSTSIEGESDGESSAIADTTSDDAALDSESSSFSDTAINSTVSDSETIALYGKEGSADEMYDAYKKALRDFVAKGKWLCEEEENDMHDIDSNSFVADFSVFDLDGDGYDELIFRFNASISASKYEQVIGYDFTKHELYEEYCGYYGLEFYENGAIEDGLSHGDPRTGDFWPYNLYVFNKNTGKYDSAGYVEALWSEAWPSDETAFLSNVDKDGNGYVYFIDSYYSSDNLKFAVDDDKYQAWLKYYTNGTEKLDIDYHDLTEEEISKIGK